MKMFEKKTLFTALLIVLFCISVILMGCKKSEEEATTETMTPSAEAVKEEAKEAASDIEIEQKMCPVMEAPINKDLFTEYQGKKVYFCCPGCKETFEENPEQYVAKLPQFNQ